jgi:hypothetical protein
MMSISTFTSAGSIHWGVMLAQGWKGELAVHGDGGQLVTSLVAKCAQAAARNTTT